MIDFIFVKQLNPIDGGSKIKDFQRPQYSFFWKSPDLRYILAQKSQPVSRMDVYTIIQRDLDEFQ